MCVECWGSIPTRRWLLLPHASFKTTQWYKPDVIRLVCCVLFVYDIHLQRLPPIDFTSNRSLQKEIWKKVFLFTCILVYFSLRFRSFRSFNVYRLQRKFAKIMFSQMSVCPQGISVQGDLCLGGSLSRGISVWGASVGGGLSRGCVSVQVVCLCPGGLCQGDPLVQ